MLQGMEQNGIEVLKCADNSPLSAVRHIKKLKKFLRKRTQYYDLIFVGFVGQPLVPIIRKLTNKPIIFDAYMSVYDTMAFDKKKFKPDSMRGRLCYMLDIYSCNAADKILLDTYQHIGYFNKEFKIDRKKFEMIPIGADDKIFYPRGIMKEKDQFTVEFHGGFIPLQGIKYIITAAKLLEKHKDIKFEIIGSGQTFAENLKLSKELDVKNVIFEGRKKYAEIPGNIAEADIGLGIFGDTDKTQRVIPNKAYEVIAMKKPLITADTPATRELFKNRENVLFCKVADPDSLADAILELKDNKELRDRIAENGYRTFKEKCTPKVLGKQIRDVAVELLNGCSKKSKIIYGRGG
jgi:glycosyltransferase involved in cell wall biosynthesis